jgi:hypothetical protein
VVVVVVLVVVVVVVVLVVELLLVVAVLAISSSFSRGMGVVDGVGQPVNSVVALEQVPMEQVKSVVGAGTCPNILNILNLLASV